MGPNLVDRRSFLRGCVAAGVLGATGAVGAAGVRGILGDAGRWEKVRYVGAKRVDGPAPRALPMIPLRLGAEGFLEGDPGHLEWYRYCGRERLPGLQESFRGDNLLRVHASREKLAFVIDDWYRGLVGRPLRPEQVPVGRGAPVRWRSEGVPQGQEVTAVVLRLEPDSFLAPVPDGVLDGLVCLCTFCTHFCCVPGWRELKLARKDRLHCSCHGSQFDPRRLVEDEAWVRVPEAES